MDKINIAQVAIIPNVKIHLKCVLAWNPPVYLLRSAKVVAKTIPSIIRPNINEIIRQSTMLNMVTIIVFKA